MTATVPTDLTITDVQSLTFSYTSHTGRDNEGHGHPAPAHQTTQRLTRIQTARDFIMIRAEHLEFREKGAGG